ncbi:RagB/SusD family nutrient uptake outer membrane protein [Niabella hirudinis]|uniref:RagB/SusD family nutrient uptake outer membrane protein n=1 Tax=Niabella hirudinis TaxID=1285929 RepID=UPI003EBAB2A1
MMKTKYILACMILICLFGQACKKYLDQKPNLTQTTPTTLEDAQALLDYSSKMNISTTPSSIETAADDYFLPSEAYNAVPSYIQEGYVWQHYVYNDPNDWGYCYLPVYTANYCLEITQKEKLNENNQFLWKNVHGSALFYRAYYFLELLMAYSKAYNAQSAKTDLGIVLRQSSDFNVASFRSSVEDCYNFIVNDLKSALLELPDLPAHVLRPSKAAAYGLLARTYLLMNRFDSALQYADRSLAIKDSLIDYNMMPCSTCDIRASLSAGSAIFKKYNKETIFYTDMNGNITAHDPSRALIDTILFNSYSNDDLRKKAFFAAKDGYYKFKGSYSQNLFINFTGITTAEMYLISAECYARTGNISRAWEQLNKLLQKRMSAGSYTPEMDIDQTRTLNRILEERRKELLYRGLRWADIKRYNSMGANISLKRMVKNQTYTLNANANYFALPLPTDIVTISGIEQNPQ